MATTPIDEQVRILRTGAVDFITESDLRRKLERPTPLRVKLGIDPTASDIHLGFAVVLRKLRQFQDLGHVAVLIIGDFTAQVGDPSGKSATRPRLTKEEVDGHAQTYLEQVQRILDFSPERLEVHRNSRWLGAMDMEAVLRLTARTTVARMLERDDFSKRYAGGSPISLTEFLYPLLQGTDSVEIRADVELGGTDQLFNNLMGRTLQQQEDQEGQCVLTTPLLEGLDGINKMSKSLGNYVGITDPPDEMFGKLMSISDELMWRYYELLSFLPVADVARLKCAVADGRNPRDVKFELGIEIVDRFHGSGHGARARDAFIARFQQGAQPDSMAEVTLHAAEGHLGLAQALKGAGLVSSTSDAIRQIRQGAVKVDGERVEDIAMKLTVGASHVVQVGKRRFARISIAA
jgi:tyrosyl-tRNA synthetase